MNMRFKTNVMTALLLSALLVGCGGNMVRKSAVPENQHVHAQVAQAQESPGVRYMVTSPEGIAAMVNDLRESQQRVGVLNLKGTLDYFIENTFNYPTLAEAYKIAALDAWNRMPK